MTTAASIRRDLRALAPPEKAAGLAWFFKTGKGEYAEGDRFLGVTVPQIRAVARRHAALAPAQLRSLLRSRYHEERLCGLVLLTREFARADGPARGRILRQYLALSPWVNNWDLVDASAPTILGESLWGGDTSLLDRLARSPSLWERRMAIVATLCFIRRGRFVETLRIAGRLLRDREDLIHKATGWMLREVGKRDRALLERFLRRHRRELPRTTLRYAIERFPPALRRKFLAR